ncbi:hypothetical protein SCB49_03990 [unidentified eubacterium SCB49]|nr:hypothetical protein SCB49_03990 [unidentified eubacterium SCB49]
MKKIALLCITLSFLACNNTEKKAEENTEEIITEVEEISAEATLNKMIDDPENEGEKMLIGKINEKGLTQDAFAWFKETVIKDDPDFKVTDELKKPIQDYDITVFMGTWCEDSQREVPHLFTILTLADYDVSRLEIYAVDHDKKTPTGAEVGKNIEYVPTIILSKDGEEIGRVVESTQESLEKDLLKIVTGQDYKHIYEE